ncbi:Gfo/Idh/MocA family oxidoreductase [Halosimplex aquaticum]
MDETSFAVVGAQNFAAEYISNIRSLGGDGVGLAGVVITDQTAEGERARELRRDGIRIFDSYEDLLRNGHRHVDVIGLPTSIASHAELSIAGMTHGYDVLLEKPPRRPSGNSTRSVGPRTGRAGSAPSGSSTSTRRRSGG